MSNGENATTNWLATATLIVLIITMLATFLGPVLAVLIQHRISQPDPNPEANQPKNLSQRKGGWFKRFLASLPYLAISLNVGLLIWVFYSNTPVTLWSVLTIAVAVGFIVLNIALILLRLAVKKIGRILYGLLDIARDQSKINTGLTDAIEIIVTKGGQKPSPEKSPDTMFDKLQNMLKYLLP